MAVTDQVAPDWRARARAAALKYGLDPDLYVRQIQQESGFDPNATSPAGAVGIAQLMPETARELGVDPRDPEASLDAGARYMRQHLDRFGGDTRRALAAYNAGPGRVEIAGGVPNIPETQDYVRRIAGVRPLAELGRLVKRKYPVYAHIPDDELGRRVKAKYPRSYQGFADVPETPAAPAQADSGAIRLPGVVAAQETDRRRQIAAQRAFPNETPEIAASRLAEFERQPPAIQATLRFGRGVMGVLPGTEAQGRERTAFIPEPQNTGERLLEGAGGAVAFGAEGAALSVLGPAAAAGIPAILMPGTTRQRYVRGLTMGAAGLGAAALPGVVGGGATAQAVTRTVAGPATFGVAAPWVETASYRLLGDRNARWPTAREMAENVGLLFGLGMAAHGAERLASLAPEVRPGFEALKRSVAEPAMAAGTAPAEAARLRRASKIATDEFNRQLKGTQLEFLQGDQVVSGDIAYGRVYPYPGVPDQVRVILHDPASGQMVPFAFRDLEALRSAVAGSEAAKPKAQARARKPKAAPVAAPERAPEPVAEKPAEVAERAGITEEQAARMSHDELVAAYEAEKAHEKSTDVRILGEEGAKRYNRLDRLRNSMSASREATDAAQREIDQIEAGLTEAQKRELFGIGHAEELVAEDLGRAVRVSESYLDIREATDAKLAATAGRSFLLKHALGDLSDRIRMARVMAEVQRRGWGPTQIEAAIREEARKRGIEPDDAMVLARAAMRRAGGKVEKEAEPATQGKAAAPARPEGSEWRQRQEQAAKDDAAVAAKRSKYAQALALEPEAQREAALAAVSERDPTEAGLLRREVERAIATRPAAAIPTGTPEGSRGYKAGERLIVPYRGSSKTRISEPARFEGYVEKDGEIHVVVSVQKARGGARETRTYPESQVRRRPKIDRRPAYVRKPGLVKLYEKEAAGSAEKAGQHYLEERDYFETAEYQAKQFDSGTEEYTKARRRLLPLLDRVEVALKVANDLGWKPPPSEPWTGGLGDFSAFGTGPIQRLGEHIVRRIKDRAAIRATEKQIEADLAEAIKRVRRGPADRVLEIIAAAEPLRGKQEELTRKERGIRAAEAKKVRVGGERGHYMRLAKMKGAYPKVQWEARAKMAQADVDALFNAINKTLPFFDALSAGDGLKRLLGYGEVPEAAQLALLEKVFGPEFVTKVLANRPLLVRLRELGYEIANVPRAYMASFDVGPLFRQGLFLSAAFPQHVPGAIWESMKSFTSDRAFFESHRQIESRRNYRYMRSRKVPLALTEVGRVTQLREEAFMGALLAENRGPVGASIGAASGAATGYMVGGPAGALVGAPLGAFLGPRGVRASNRAYSGFLNRIRADAFDALMGDFERARMVPIGRGRPRRPGEQAKMEAAALINEFVNTASGRGSFRLLSRHLVALNAFLFSPALQASRFKLLSPAYLMPGTPAPIRRAYLRGVYGIGGAALTMTALAAYAGLNVGHDSTNPDFGKIRVGNTRYDLWGGFQQYVRLYAQMVAYANASIGMGPAQQGTPLGTLGRFAWTKTSPLVNAIIGALLGENVARKKFKALPSGDPFDPKARKPGEILERVIPMVLQDMWDVGRESPEQLPYAFPAAEVGIGIQTYADSQRRQRRPRRPRRERTE